MSRLLVLGLVLLTAAPARADSSATDTVLSLMNERIELRDFQQPMTLKEAFGLVHEKLAARNVEAPILVDSAAFREADPDLNVNDSAIDFPPSPRQLTLAGVLQVVLGQLPVKASYVVRQGMIVVTTQEHAQLGHLLQMRVPASFRQRPLGQAIDEISEYTGISVVVDRRVEDCMKMPVSVRFRANVTAEDALRLLVQTADLKIVVLPSAVFVTTPAVAAEMREEVSNAAAAAEALPTP